MSDRKTTVHRSEHLRVYKFASFTSVIIYIWTLIAPPLLFQFAKRNEKVMSPLYVLNFTCNPPSVLLSFSPKPPPLIFQPPPPLQVIIAQSLIGIEIERTQIRFSSEVFVAVAVVASNRTLKRDNMRKGLPSDVCFLFTSRWAYNWGSF